MFHCEFKIVKNSFGWANNCTLILTNFDIPKSIAHSCISDSFNILYNLDRFDSFDILDNSDKLDISTFLAIFFAILIYPPLSKFAIILVLFASGRIAKKVKSSNFFWQFTQKYFVENLFLILFSYPFKFCRFTQT